MRAFFGGSALADAPNEIFWLKPAAGAVGADDPLLKARVSDPRVVCIDRLYVGSDTQCALNHEMDAPAANRAECESAYKMYRRSTAKLIGGADEAAMLSPIARGEMPRICFVDRVERKSGKAIVNLQDVLAALRARLVLRFGEGHFVLETVTCESFVQSVRWWAHATIVIMSRGACQANMPLTRDGGGLLWIGPCVTDLPQMAPMPRYFHVEVYHPPMDAELVRNGQCNARDYAVPPDALASAFDSLLARVHGS